MPKLPLDERIDAITELVSQNFRCFGGKRDAKNEPCPNPIAIAMQGKPPTFAAGVDVEQVVAFVLGVNREI